jgi:hypothetical protein
LIAADDRKEFTPALKALAATHEEGEHTLAKAVDGDGNTGWSTADQPGRDQAAVLEAMPVQAMSAAQEPQGKGFQVQIKQQTPLDHTVAVLVAAVAAALVFLLQLLHKILDTVEMADQE